MKRLADESVDGAVVERLRQEGHDVVYVAELSPSIMDDEVLWIANDRHSLLVTTDKDFGELVFRLSRVHVGVIPLRLAGLALATKADIVVVAFRTHSAELPGAFSVITQGQVRIRRVSGA